jgi:hypothetical protein
MGTRRWKRGWRRCLPHRRGQCSAAGAPRAAPQRAQTRTQHCTYRRLGATRPPRRVAAESLGHLRAQRRLNALRLQQGHQRARSMSDQAAHVATAAAAARLCALQQLYLLRVVLGERAELLSRGGQLGLRVPDVVEGLCAPVRRERVLRTSSCRSPAPRVAMAAREPRRACVDGPFFISGGGSTPQAITSGDADRVGCKAAVSDDGGGGGGARSCGGLTRRTRPSA